MSEVMNVGVMNVGQSDFSLYVIDMHQTTFTPLSDSVATICHRYAHLVSKTNFVMEFLVEKTIPTPSHVGPMFCCRHSIGQ